MSYQPMGSGEPSGSVCHYGGSKLPFRGPRRKTDGPYVACIGGDETFGRFVEYPFPAVLERKLDRQCINLGSLFCGVEALCRDADLLELANGAELCVLQVPGVLGQSNRYYHVHPRRNDRIVCSTPDLTALYPEEDFIDVHFVRHLMTRLRGHADDRFGVIARELRQSWCTRLRGFLERIKPPVVLVWLENEVHSAGDPVRIEPWMLNALEPFCSRVVAMQVRMSGASEELEDMLFGTLQQPMAERMIGPATHRRIAEALVPVLRDLN